MSRSLFSQQDIKQFYGLHLFRGDDHSRLYQFRWYFKGSGNDIGFGIYRLTEDSNPDQSISEMEMVYPHFRICTNVVPEFGELKINVPGTCK